MVLVVLLIIAGGVQHTFTARRVIELEKRVNEHFEDPRFHAALKERIEGNRELIEVLARIQGDASDEIAELRHTVNFSCVSEEEMREIVSEEVRYALAARGIGWGRKKE